MFEDLGYSTVADKFGLVPYREGNTRRIDVFAYRWNGDQAQVAAIECKDVPPPQGIALAISQAIDMMLFVGETYIATPVGSSSKTPENLNILSRLGIGYIALDGDQARIVATPNPERLSIRQEDLYDTQVRSRAKFLLAFREAAGTNSVKMGGLQHYLDTWISTSLMGEVQHNAWVGGEWFFSGLNLEHKPTAYQVFNRIDTGRVRELTQRLQQLPDEYEVHLHRKRKVPATFEMDQHPKKANSMDEGDVKELVASAKRILAESQWRPQLSVSRPVWPLIEDISRLVAVKRLGSVRADIGPVAECLS